MNACFVQSMAPETLDRDLGYTESQLKAAKLAAVEKLLWGGVGNDQAVASQTSGITMRPCADTWLL